MEQSTTGRGNAPSTTHASPSSHGVGVTSAPVALKEGAWDGQPCYIVGGGPSLKSFPWDTLKSKRNVIVINRAFVNCPTADIFFTEDARFLLRFPAEYPKEWAALPGLKIWHCVEDHESQNVPALAPGLTVIPCKRKDKFWSHYFADGLSYSSNSGVGAINIACLLEADPIYLLGFDCRAEGHRMENYHNDYKKDPMWEVGTNAADSFKSDFEYWVAPHTKDRNIINLINPAYESALTCWPKKPWSEVL